MTGRLATRVWVGAAALGRVAGIVNVVGFPGSRHQAIAGGTPGAWWSVKSAGAALPAAMTGSIGPAYLASRQHRRMGASAP